ncbi:MAG: cyclase family protein, partial [Clostridia bacterium]|nr:cyclase family protein [Clostridia bacterium]
MDFRIIDITKDLVTTTPYPGDPAPELSVFSAIGNGDACNMAKLFTTLHCGTHADAPLHFIPGGKPINAVETDRFIGECE